MRYLITGSAGFIGYHLAQRLLDEGHQVTGFDAMTPYYDVSLKEARNGLLARHSGFTAAFGKLEDADALNRAADLAKPDIIVHLAAQAGVRYSLENPKAYIDSNLIGSWNVLELGKKGETTIISCLPPPVPSMAQIPKSLSRKQTRLMSR